LSYFAINKNDGALHEIHKHLNTKNILILAGSLWERICRKEFPKERRQEFESWRELYERCTTARKEKLDFLTVRVQQSYKNVSSTVFQCGTKCYVDFSPRVCEINYTPD
jgi:hypothetical protein